MSTQSRKPKGTPVGGQFASQHRAESTCQLNVASNAYRKTIAGHEYLIVVGAYGDGRRTYDLLGTEKGGWRITYDPATMVAKVEGREPVNPSREWLDVGEASIVNVLSVLEPETKTFVLRGTTYEL